MNPIIPWSSAKHMAGSGPSFLPDRAFTLFGWATRSGYSILLLDHVEFGDNSVSVVSAVNKIYWHFLLFLNTEKGTSLKSFPAEDGDLFILYHLYQGLSCHYGPRIHIMNNCIGLFLLVYSDFRTKKVNIR